MKWGELILEHKKDLARILTYETGKPLADSKTELDIAASYSWWFSGEADRIQGSYFDSVTMLEKKVVTIKQPIGVVAALLPWNFPIA